MQYGEKMIKVLTDSTNISGLGRYAHNLQIFDNLELISIKLDNKKNDNLFSGKLFKPLSKDMPFPYIFNKQYPEIFFRNYQNYIKKNLTKNDILHYSHPAFKKINGKFKEIVTFHDLFPFVLDKNLDNQVSKKYFLQWKDNENLISISEITKKDMINHGFNENNITVIHHYIPLDFFDLKLSDEDKIFYKKMFNFPLDKKLILNVSSNNKYKNLNIIKEIADKLGNKYQIIHIGDKINNNIISFKNISNLALNYIYNICDVLVIPSLNEGFNYPFLEGLGANIPMVMSNIPIFKEITDYKFPLMLDLNDYLTYIKAFCNAELTYNYESLKELYSIDVFKEKMIKFYNKVYEQ